ncbi:MAG: hypothetical protein ACPG47_02020 [Leucothrix sp.]
MKIIITMTLSVSFIVVSGGIIAEQGLMRAIGKVDNQPKPIISVAKLRRPINAKHIRELHGDAPQPPKLNVSQKRQQRLAQYKAKLRKQKQERLLGLRQTTFTAAY